MAFSYGARLAIIASQVPFCLAAIEDGGWWAVGGWTALVVYVAIAIATTHMKIADYRRKRPAAAPSAPQE